MKCSAKNRTSLFFLVLSSLMCTVLLGSVSGQETAESKTEKATAEKRDPRDKDEKKTADKVDSGAVDPSEPKQENEKAADIEKSDELDDNPLTQEELFRAMTLTSRSFRAAAEKVQPSLVTIESYGGVGAVQGRIGGIRKQGEGNTTGIMISPDGYILTSTFNFIQQPPVITVITSDGKRRFARTVGRDDTRKICLLKIEGVKDMPVPEMVNLDDIDVGQWCVSLGVGYGDTSPALSMGIISAKNRIGGRAIQTDANISPANYGGPLVDKNGRVLGLCVPMNPQSQAIGAGVEWYDSGIGFAIPLAGTKALMRRLKNGERIYPAFLGVQAVKNPNGKGLLVKKALENTAASEAGIEDEDIILALNDQKLDDMLKLRQLLNQFESGDTVILTVYKTKTDEEETLEFELGTPPKPKGEENQLEPPKIR
ncbi:MAG: S1C family serine protease [Mariniblastus sp.]